MQGMGPKRPSTGSMSARATANLMLEAKNTRKRAEADVHLLANRLAHLQAEEEKARKKTEETKQVYYSNAVLSPSPTSSIRSGGDPWSNAFVVHCMMTAFCSRGLCFSGGKIGKVKTYFPYCELESEYDI